MSIEKVASRNIKDEMREDKRKLINLKGILKFNRIKTVTVKVVNMLDD